MLEAPQSQCAPGRNHLSSWTCFSGWSPCFFHGPPSPSSKPHLFQAHPFSTPKCIPCHPSILPIPCPSSFIPVVLSQALRAVTTALERTASWLQAVLQLTHSLALVGAILPKQSAHWHGVSEGESCWPPPDNREWPRAEGQWCQVGKTWIRCCFLAPALILLTNVGSYLPLTLPVLENPREGYSTWVLASQDQIWAPTSLATAPAGLAPGLPGGPVGGRVPPPYPFSALLTSELHPKGCSPILFISVFTTALSSVQCTW